MAGKVQLEIPQGLSRWEVLRARIGGVTPLLMHNPANMRGGQGTATAESA